MCYINSYILPIFLKSGSSKRKNNTSVLRCEYCVPSLPYLMKLHDSPRAHLFPTEFIRSLSHKYHQSFSWAFLPRSNTCYHSQSHSLAIPRLSDVYVESHNLAFALCMITADKRVLHALRSKENQEGQWKREMVKHGVVRWKAKL